MVHHSWLRRKCLYSHFEEHDSHLGSPHKPYYHHYKQYSLKGGNIYAVTLDSRLIEPVSRLFGFSLSLKPPLLLFMLHYSQVPSPTCTSEQMKQARMKGPGKRPTLGVARTGMQPSGLMRGKCL